MSDSILEQVFRIWTVNHEGAYLEVSIDEDGMLTIKTTNPQSNEYFGKVDFSLEPEVAAKVADAIKFLTSKGK